MCECLQNTEYYVKILINMKVWNMLSQPCVLVGLDLTVILSSAQSAQDSINVINHSTLGNPDNVTYIIINYISIDFCKKSIPFILVVFNHV